MKLLPVLIFGLATLTASWGDQVKSLLSLGGGVVFESVMSGGTLEVGFPIWDHGLEVRDYLTAEGKGSEQSANNLGGIWLGDKLTFGGILGNQYHTYAFVQASVGFWAGTAETWTSLGPSFQVCGGGGLEWILDAQHSFFTELGGGGYFAPQTLPFPLEAGFAQLTSGFRLFF